MGDRGLSVLAAATPPPVPESVTQTLASEGDAPEFLLRTGNRVDVGLWFRQRRVWAAGFGDRLVLVAPGPRPYIETMSSAMLRESVYNHVTRTLVFGPGTARLVGIAVSPAVGHALLDYLGVPADAYQRRYGLGDAPRRNNVQDSLISDEQNSQAEAWKETKDA